MRVLTPRERIPHRRKNRCSQRSPVESAHTKHPSKKIRHYAVIFSVGAACCLCFSWSSPGLHADEISSIGVTEGGTVLKFDRDIINFARECRNNAIDARHWMDGEEIRFTSSCSASNSNSSSHVAEPSCPTTPLQLFEIEFVTGKSVLAEGAALTADNIIHFDLLKPWVQAHGPKNEVRAIRRRKVCRESLSEGEAFPDDFCWEQRQVAVAFDYHTPLSNKILTNGFSFSLEVHGDPPPGFKLDDFGDEVRKAFQNAIGLWVSSLSGHDKLLTPSIRSFIASRTLHSSNGYVMEIPPQVIRLRCPQSATFMIDLVFSSVDLFPKFPVALARAKVEGRTIALNMSKFRFRTDYKFANGRLGFELPDGAINLVPIMTHELGHAFGLHHSDVAGTPSIMDSQFSYDALVPQIADVKSLVEVLDKSISGARPGELQFVSSSGVRPPEGFNPHYTPKR